jgi:acetylornithine/succinyldiaminopimelate/putrescine aminotransferase/acyl-coenzyme A synthetase/AMP-(fatty) acid ligase/predicted amino acid dehydrogenase
MDDVEILESSVPLPEPSRASNLAELLFRQVPGEDDTEPIIMGTAGLQGLDVSLRTLRCATINLVDQLDAWELCTGDTVCLARLPRTSETIVAGAYAALSVSGLRVLFPMYLEPDAFHQWLASTGTKAVLWSAGSLQRTDRHEADLILLERLAEVAAGLGVPCICLDDDLNLSNLFHQDLPESPDLCDAHVQRLTSNTNLDTECLILTTSGTSGRSKLVRYRQGAFLRSATSWEIAGLFHPERQGGRGLCLLLAHSMGLRAFWNAIWTRQATCLIPPEWVHEHPERVHALLQHMRPQHVTGGPAVYRTLLELSRLFPQLRDTCLHEMRSVVSSGATFDEATARRIEGALGIPLDNAFGMTETMQVLSTQVDGPFQGGLGNPLPGVKLALQKFDVPGRSLYRFYVQSPFGFEGYLDQEEAHHVGALGPDWFDTGDLVELNSVGLFHAGREEQDFMKDSFGVKVARALLLKRYSDLGGPVNHVECFPIREEPGLAAIVFVEKQGAVHQTPGGWITNRPLLRSVKTLLEGRLESLHRTLEDFEIRHLTIARFACVAGLPPRTAKGNIARSRIAERYATLVEQLTGHYLKRPGLERLNRVRLLRSSTIQFTKPERGELLRAARLDKQYEAGIGDRIYYREQGVNHEIVDMAGGFGCTLLGHRHPEVVKAARDYLAGDGIVLADQGSARLVEGEFARSLALAVSKQTGASYVVRLGSTGAEAVEMALAHAFIEQRHRVRRFIRNQKRRYGRLAPKRIAKVEDRARDVLDKFQPVVLAIDGSFHGCSLGARSVRGRGRNYDYFRALTGIERILLPPDGQVDLDSLISSMDIRTPALVLENGQLIECEERFSPIIAAIAEPVRGEGGVHEVNPDLLKKLASYTFPLILDEIQCGLGRTGSFLASEGIRGHYYLFGKALGGAVAKITALLIDRERYRNSFDKRYASTFAGDAFSCAVASRVLKVIEDDEIPARAAARGRVLRERLEQVQRAFPDVLCPIQGKGLMLGIELDPSFAEEAYVLRMLAKHKHLGLLASSYLLNRHGVRVLPTISAWNTLRVEPSAYVDDEAIEQLAQGLEALCNALRKHDSYELMSCLVEEDIALGEPIPDKELFPQFTSVIEPPAPGAVRVALLNHFLHPERDVAFVEPSLRRLPPGARRALFHRLIQVMDLKASILFARNLFDNRVWFASVTMPIDTAELESLHRSGKHSLITERIQEAVDWSAEIGCEVVGLGAHTSILTADGTALVAPAGVRLTTGNTLTVAAGVRRLCERCEDYGLVPGSRATRLAIVGATGNIGSALSHQALLGKQPFRKVTLVGRDLNRLNPLRESLLKHWVERKLGPAWQPELHVSTEMSALRTYNVIIVAAGTNEPLVDAHHLSAAGPVLLADLSVPSVVTTHAYALPNVHRVDFAGIVSVNGTPDFAMAAHIEPGTAFSCAGETMLLGLALKETRHMDLVGSIDPGHTQVLDQLAECHGFYDAVEMDSYWRSIDERSLQLRSVARG